LFWLVWLLVWFFGWLVWFWVGLFWLFWFVVWFVLWFGLGGLFCLLFFVYGSVFSIFSWQFGWFVIV